MTSRRIGSQKILSVLSIFFLSGACVAVAADRAKNKPPADLKDVELFEAMKDGDIAVRLIPKNVREANVLIENKGDKPLHIRLPDAAAGVPVLAQRGVGNQGMGGMGGMGGGMGGQQGMGMGMGGMGGGMGGMGGGMGGMGGGMGGFMNVEPGKVGKFKVATVCLEHGKQDPTPHAAYELRPIESFTKSQPVIELCKMLGRGEVPQNVAQAATWHLTDGLTWEQLAAKDKVRLSNGYTEKYFSPDEVAVAMRVVQEASRRAEAERTKAPSASGSLSRN